MIKNDNNQPATKSDLIELKNEVNQKIENGFIELLKTQTDVRNIKETMATTMATKDDINRIMNAIDVFAGEAKDYRRKDADRGHMLMEHHDKLENHESRVTALEAKK